MKKIGVFLGGISLLSLVYAGGAFAEDRDLAWHLMKGSTFTGANVKNPQGETLGDIKDMVIDRASGRVAYAVVSFGGFLGMGEKLFAVPWSAFAQPDTSKDTFVLAMDKERLKNAPGFDHNNWPQMASREWVTTLYTYYNVSPFWMAFTGAGMTVATVKSVNQTEKTITLQVDGETLKDLQAGDSTQVMIRKKLAAK